MLNKCKIIVATLLFLQLFPSTSQAQQTLNFNEWVGVDFPVSNSSVSSAMDYFVYMVATDKPELAGTAKAVNYFGMRAGTNTSTFNAFIHAGLYVSNEGYRWFAAASPSHPNAPVVECLRGNPAWYNSGGRETGCVSGYGDLGLGQNQWLRVQIVTYRQGFWIVRLQNPGTGAKVDVAKIHNPNTTLTDADIVGEESWSGVDPTQNPWVKVKFYDLDFKYRTNYYWNHMPSDIGGDYGLNNIWEASNSSSDPCPSHYGITKNIQNNPYLWFVGTGGSNCSGKLYSGGGPSTAVTSMIGNNSGKFMSSENGQNCIMTNRNWPGQWEEWHEQLNSGIVSYRGNNGKWAKRRSNDDLWEDAGDANSNDAKFDFIPIGGSSIVFRLRNKGNNLYVDHNSGTSCTEADVSSPGSEEVFRYVAY